ncbi:V-type proton ATPase subunit S1 isoform X1 [Hydra vulgaris]|uniref:V-type proton ATPase subunit S1 isoform X1 n=1 Tax=Hydra vulgaris TaxID=6087 RepID=UPI0006412FA4|nr:V-type proton ATPase subunit S1 [Hydra vulgaris]
MVARKYNEMAALYYVLVLAFAFAQLVEGFHFTTPLIIWKNTKKLVPENILAGHTYKASDVFEKYIQQELNQENNVFVFIQDELSMDDFMKYPDSFNYLKYAIENHGALLFPAVSQKQQSFIKLIQNHSAQSVEEIFSSDLSDWKYNSQSKSHVYIFHLDPVIGAELKKDILLQNNKHIKKIISEVDEIKKPYSVVFTSQQPSQFISNILSMEQLSGSSISSRHLLSQETSVSNISTGTFFNNSCVFLFASSIKFGFNSTTVDFINPNNSWSVGGFCSNSSNRFYSISMETKNNDDKLSLKIEMGFENQTLYWTCLNITVNAMINKTEIQTFFPCDHRDFSSDTYFAVRAPYDFSYTCSDIQFKSLDYILTIRDLQLEPGMSGFRVFSTDYSCTGFFTLEILTGLMTVFVMIIGLVVGIGMLSAIQTQDRFDDPKGKTISVPLTE